GVLAPRRLGRRRASTTPSPPATARSARTVLPVRRRIAPGHSDGGAVLAARGLARHRRDCRRRGAAIAAALARALGVLGRRGARRFRARRLGAPLGGTLEAPLGGTLGARRLGARRLGARSLGA